MKNESLWGGIRTLIRIAFRYARQHSASLEAMKCTYTRQGAGGDDMATILEIKPLGSLYQITTTVCLGELPLGKEIWLATYGWHSNGHLIEIGGDRYCIFDSLQKTLYIEEVRNSCKTIVTYTQK